MKRYPLFLAAVLSIAAFAPLAYAGPDLSLARIVSPRSTAIASDSIAIVVQVCNNDTVPVASAPLVCNYNNQYTCRDNANFAALIGEGGLAGGACYNYTFSRRFHVSIGTSTLQAYVNLPSDTDRSNDTLSHQFQGITSGVELEAVNMLLDTTDTLGIRVQMAVYNGSSRPVNGFVMGFFLDGDTNHLFRRRVNNFHIATGTIGYRYFDTILAPREQGYADITAFVSIEGDVNTFNDTTTTVVEPYLDARAVKVIVQDNEQTSSLVRFRVANEGNFELRPPYQLKVVVNGEPIVMDGTLTLPPAGVHDYEFSQPVAKNQSGAYSGSGTVICQQDDNQANNQTNTVEVVARFAAIDAPFDIEQFLWVGANYPNPCRTYTTFDFRLPQARVLTVGIVDPAGRLLSSHTSAYSAGRHSHTLNVGMLPAGLYHYVVQCAEDRIVRPMIVQ